MLDTGRQIFPSEIELPRPAFYPYLSENRIARLLTPYLPRISRGIIADWSVSDDFFDEQRVHYGLNSPARLSLSQSSRIKDYKSRGAVQVILPGSGKKLIISPLDVISRQERLADFAFSFDFPIPSGALDRERNKRFRLSIHNAVWMLENTRRRNLILFAVIQGWDERSYREAAKKIAQAPFKAVAIGGLQQFAGNAALIERVVSAVRDETAADRLLHAFGTVPNQSNALLAGQLISSAAVKPERLAIPVPDDAPAEKRLPALLCRFADLNRIGLPLSAYRLTKRL